MGTSRAMRQLAHTLVLCRVATLPTRTSTLLPPQARYLSTPTILRPSFWTSMIPKPFRERSEQPRSKEWNPATPYIILGLLVGSQAIQSLWLKQERAHSLRKAEAKIGILREVIERVQNGEEVDVERVLGTGNQENEREWAEVLKDIQQEEALFQSKKKRKALRELAAREGAEQKDGENATEEQGRAKVESIGGVRFY